MRYRIAYTPSPPPPPPRGTQNRRPERRRQGRARAAPGRRRRFASTTTTRLGSTVEASSSASSAASPATSTTTNVVEHPTFKIVRTDDVPEYGAACIIACDKCDKCDIACDKCDIACDKCNKCDIACDKCDMYCAHGIKTYDCLMSENSLGIFLSGERIFFRYVEYYCFSVFHKKEMRSGTHYESQTCFSGRRVSRCGVARWLLAGR